MRLKVKVLAVALVVALATITAMVFLSKPSYIRFGIAPFLGGYMVTYAYENGYVEGPQGVKLEIVHTLKFNEYLMTGKVEMGEISTAAFAIAREKGIPLKIVSTAVVQGNEMGNALLFVPPGSNIKSPSDLKGKRVGVPGLKKTTTVIFLGLLNKKYGITEEELQLIDISPPQIPERLRRGDVDAALAIGDVAAYMYMKSDQFKLLWDVSEAFKEEYGDYPIVAVVAVHEDLLKTRPDYVREVMDTLRRSLEWGKGHVDEVVESFAKAKGGDPEVYRMSLKQYQWRFTLTEKDVELIMAVFELMKEQGLIGSIPTREEAFAAL